MVADILDTVEEMLRHKDKLYGDAFYKVWEEYDLTATSVLLSIKLSRLKSLEKRGESATPFIKDTLMDIIGYCVLTLHELRGKKLERRKHLLIEPDQCI